MGTEITRDFSKQCLKNTAESSSIQEYASLSGKI